MRRRPCIGPAQPGTRQPGPRVRPAERVSDASNPNLFCATDCGLRLGGGDGARGGRAQRAVRHARVHRAGDCGGPRVQRPGGEEDCWGGSCPFRGVGTVAVLQHFGVLGLPPAPTPHWGAVRCGAEWLPNARRWTSGLWAFSPTRRSAASCPSEGPPNRHCSGQYRGTQAWRTPVGRPGTVVMLTSPRLLHCSEACKPTQGLTHACSRSTGASTHPSRPT